MNLVLLPIKSKYVKKILSGEKTTELRKKEFKQIVDKILICESGIKKL